MKKLRNSKNDFTRILITGAGTGLGKFASITLARRGYHVFATVKNQSEIAFFEKIVISENLKIDSFCLNILDPNDRKIISELDIDILVCNGAIRQFWKCC